MVDHEGQLIEYLVPFPMHVFEELAWPPITYQSDGVPVCIQRPITVTTPYQPENRIGNEGAEAFCTIFRLTTLPGAELTPQEGWEIIERLLEWVRIKCRYYWILHGFTGFGALYRGTSFTSSGRRLSLRNMASYSPGVVVLPLTRALWMSLRDDLEGKAEIPLADSIFCDALLSLAARDEMKALLEAGVAMEVAITQLLIEVSLMKPDSASRTKFRKEQGDFHSFRKKLTEWPQSLGLERAADFRCEGMQDTWIEGVQGLYKLRNCVAHSGKLKSGTPSARAATYIFAASTMLEYCRLQRFRVGLENYSMPAGSSPLQQLILCHDAILDTTTTDFECLSS